MLIYAILKIKIYTYMYVHSKIVCRCKLIHFIDFKRLVVLVFCLLLSLGDVYALLIIIY